MPDELMHKYINMYFSAAQENLEAAGEPILDWFSRMLTSEETLRAIRQEN
jgi:hypothetical protein